VKIALPVTFMAASVAKHLKFSKGIKNKLKRRGKSGGKSRFKFNPGVLIWSNLKFVERGGKMKIRGGERQGLRDQGKCRGQKRGRLLLEGSLTTLNWQPKKRLTD